MHIKGLIAAPFTAMREDGQVNLDLISKQVEMLYENHLQGAFVCGTTGESLSLTVPEREAIAKCWVDAAPKDFKVIVHVGHGSIEASKRLATHAREIGAWGIGCMGPVFFKPATVNELVDYCRQIAAAAADLPFYYYHLPALTGNRFPMIEFLQSASDTIPNLAGIKYTFEDLMDFQSCRLFQDGRYDMLFGRDEILLCGLVLGTQGAVGSTYNFAAPLYLSLIREFQAGRLQQARHLQWQSMQLVRLLRSIDSDFLPAAKSVMKYLGLDCGPVRPPLQNISDAQYRRLVSGLEQLGLPDLLALPITMK